MMMTRRSPIHDWFEQRHPQWKAVGGMSIAVQLQTEMVEQRAIQSLALCDVSALPKLGVRGPDAERFLTEQGIDAPTAIFDSRRLADGGLVVRLGANEFFIENGISDGTVADISQRLDSANEKLFRVERQEATIMLIGAKAIGVLAQTCGIDFRDVPMGRVILTRVAGVSCGVFPDQVGTTRGFRLWVDYTYAVYVWETFVEICEDLDGYIIGADSIFPELR